MPVARSRARRLAGALRRRGRRWAGRLRDAMPTRLPAWAPAGVASGVARSSPGELDRTEFVVESADALPAMLVGTAALATTRQFKLVVERWQAPVQGWSGRLGPLPHLVRHELVLPERGTGRAEITVVLAEPLPLPRIAAAALAALRPELSLPHPASADLTAPAAVLGWLDSTGIDARGDAADAAVIRPYDLVWAGDPSETLVPEPARVTATAVGIIAPGGSVTVLVDARGANPSGRRRYGAHLPHGRLHLGKPSETGSKPSGTDSKPSGTGESPADWWIDQAPAGPTVVAGRIGDPLHERQRSVLAGLGLVTAMAPGADVRPDEHAAVLAQLAMTGAPLHVADLSDATAALLDGTLAALLAAPVPGADPLEWEIRSVAQRRAALRGHATGFGLCRAAAAAYPSLRRPPTVSALLVTRRPHLVLQAVAALAAQTYPELEVIVGLHGVELPDGVRTELAGCGIEVQVLTVPAELSFGEALGEATRRASGSLLTKVDDDDRYGPEHIWDLVLARHYSGATVVGKGAEFVHLQQRDLTVRRRMAAETYTDVVAGGTMLLGRGDLEAVGGWRPVDRSVDRALLDRVLQAGGLVYRTHGFGFIYTRHADGHTWDPGDEYFLRDAARRFDGLPPYAEFGTVLDRAAA